MNQVITNREKLHEFALRYLEMYRNPETEEIDLYAGFSEECFSLGIEMDVGRSFSEKYSAEAFRNSEALSEIFDEVNDVQALANAVFSNYRRITYWSYENLSDEENRKWFVTAFRRLAGLTE